MTDRALVEKKLAVIVGAVSDLRRLARQQQALPGPSVCGTARSSIGHSGSPVSRVNAKMKPCLVVWSTAGTFGARPPRCRACP
jgi:hypothetical protein